MLVLHTEGVRNIYVHCFSGRLRTEAPAIEQEYREARRNALAEGKAPEKLADKPRVAV